MSDGDPAAGWEAYEQDMPLWLVAEYIIYNIAKHRPLGDESQKVSTSISGKDKELMEYYASRWKN